MDTKECTKCGEVKALDEFAKNKASKGGRTNECKPCKNARMRAISNEQRERNKSCSRDWKSRNKAAIAEVQSRWKKLNRDHETAQQNKRHAAKLQRRPSWANEQLINAFYKEAKRLEELTGIKFHVDHIIPMQGELVSGLDVETNLQILTAHENIGKSNSFDPMTFCA